MLDPSQETCTSKSFDTNEKLTYLNINLHFFSKRENIRKANAHKK